MHDVTRCVRSRPRRHVKRHRFLTQQNRCQKSACVRSPFRRFLRMALSVPTEHHFRITSASTRAPAHQHQDISLKSSSWWPIFILQNFRVEVFLFKSKIRKMLFGRKQKIKLKAYPNLLLDDANYDLEENDSSNVLNQCHEKLCYFCINYI